MRGSCGVTKAARGKAAAQGARAGRCSPGARAARPETVCLQESLLLHAVLPGMPPLRLFERLKALLIWPQCRSVLEINEKGEKKKLLFDFY